MARLGLGYETLPSRTTMRLIYVSISGLRPARPVRRKRPASDSIAQAFFPA